MNNYNYFKSGVITYNLYEVLEYVMDHTNSEEEVDISQFQEILEDMYANIENAHIIFRIGLPEATLEYIPQISALSNSFPFIGAIATLQNLQTLDTMLFYAERRDEGVWFGYYYSLPNAKNLNSVPIKSLTQINDLIRNRKRE